MRKSLMIMLTVQMVLTGSSLLACTVFYASDGEIALGGNNEDWFNPNTKIWFLPPEEGKYGRMYVGFDDFFPQGGMNDQGLFFDGLATEPLKVVLSKDKEKYRGNLVDKVMEECATVEEVLEVFDKYNLEFMERAMFMIGDKTGDSAIIEGDDIIRKKGRYQVVTNFYQSRAKPGEYPCERYNIAVDMFENSPDISVDVFRRILAAVHQESPGQTLYSNVYDLKQGIIYLYHFHNYENVVKIDLSEELEKGEHRYDLPSLFPRTYAAEVFQQQKMEEMERRKAARPVADVDPEVYDAYVGRYEMPPEVAAGAVITVTREGDKLYGQVTGQEKVQVFPESETHFFYTAPQGDVEVTFVKDETGQVTQLIVEISGQKIPARRIQ